MQSDTLSFSSAGQRNLEMDRGGEGVTMVAKLENSVHGSSAGRGDLR